MMLCVNNLNGQNSGKIEACQVGDFIKLENWEGQSFKLVEGGFQIGRKIFAHHGYNYHVGNIFWDCAWVTPEVAAQLLNHLKASEGWSIEEAENNIWKKWEAAEVKEIFNAGIIKNVA